MTTKPWGDEPAMACTKPMKINYSDGSHQIVGNVDYCGFTKLERACIDLKVPHPDLPPELRELILESRRLDYAGKAMQSLIPLCVNDDRKGYVYDEYIAKEAYRFADAMLKELEKKNEVF